MKDQIKILYEKMLEREKYLKAQEDTEENKWRIQELTLAIIKVQQLLLSVDNKPKSNLTERISAGLDRELERQKKAGKKFISDEEIDGLIDKIIKQELGDSWKDKYN